MTMTRNEILDLISLAAVYDSRTVGDEDVTGWWIIAGRHGWRAAAARRVLIEHYGEGAGKPRLTPAAVTDALRDVRRRAAESFEPPVIPAGLPAIDYPHWYRARLNRHVEVMIDRWAEGEDLPLAPVAAGGPVALHAAPSGLRQGLARDLDRAGRMPTDV